MSISGNKRRIVSAVGAFCVTVVVVDIVTIDVENVTTSICSVCLISKKKEGGVKWRTVGLEIVQCYGATALVSIDTIEIGVSPIL